jgi:hypothetical protein
MLLAEHHVAVRTLGIATDAAELIFPRGEVKRIQCEMYFIMVWYWYAAVEQVSKATGAREVRALLCLVRYNPRAPEGYIFGYKDMEESVGRIFVDPAIKYRSS